MAEGYISMQVGFSRMNKNPLTDDQTFSSITELERYIDKGLWYPGQIVTVQEEPVKVYVIQATGLYTEIQGAGGGDSPFKLKGIVASIEELPESSESGDMYLVGPEEDGSYMQYVWIVSDEETGEGEWKLMGNTSVSLDNVLTKLEPEDKFQVNLPGGSLGGIQNGTWIDSTLTWKDFLKMLLQKAEAGKHRKPTLSVNINGYGSQDVEVGTTFEANNLVVNTSYNNNPPSGTTGAGELTNFGVTFRGESLVDFENNSEVVSSVPYPDIVQVNEGTLYAQARAAYEEGPIPNDTLGNPDPDNRCPAGTVSASASITGRRRMFTGTSTTGEAIAYDSAGIRSLTGQWASKKSVTISVPTGTMQVVFAYPKSFGEVLRITDSLAFGADIITAPNLNGPMTVQVTGLNDLFPADYYVYAFENSVPQQGDTTYTYHFN